jgi:UDP-N-acetylmuramoylalanine--D-glutamate ligase
MNTLKDKKITILGAGRTGLAAARFLHHLGADVFVSDQAPLSPSARHELTHLGIPFEEQGHSELALAHAQLLILSPAVPLHSPIVQQARARGIPVWAELELAYRLCPSTQIIAVTGTTGKSTTTTLIATMLTEAGQPTITAGNIGTPLIAQLPHITPQTLVVLEVSSFQLEAIESFRPAVAVLLNIAPNHLDRHGSFLHYAQAKCRIFENQTEHDLLIVPRQLQLPALTPNPSPVREDGRGVGRGEGPRLLYYDDLMSELSHLRLPRHLREDAAAAWAACRAVVPTLPPPTEELVRRAQLPHRQEFIAEIGGVKFYDDSKATTVHATLAAVEAFAGPLVLIVGGRNKNGDFAPLADAVRTKPICEILVMGEAGPQIARALEAAGVRRFSFVRDFSEAVERALRYPGATCLLSPACASFDQFRSYEERGRAFRAAVLQRV